MTSLLLLLIAQPAGALFIPGPMPTIHVGPMAGRPVVVDVNLDKKADILVACGPCCGSPTHPQAGNLHVLLGDGTGRFRPAGAPIRIAESARKVAVGDFNGDGRPDAVVAEHDSYDLTVLIGDGKGGFSKGAPVRASAGGKPHTHEVAVADMNLDGKLDLLATNASDQTVSILIGSGDGRFEQMPGSPFQVARHPYDSLTIRDMNGDGLPDVVVPDLAANTVRVLFGDASGALLKDRRASITVGERPGFATVGDLNMDGNLDVIATHDDVPRVDVNLGDGKGGFKPAPGCPMRVEAPRFLWDAVVEEFDGDGKPDVALGIAGGNGFMVLLGDGRGGLKAHPPRPYPAGAGSGHLALGDFNGDGSQDIVTGNYDDGTLSILLGTRHPH